MSLDLCLALLARFAAINCLVQASETLVLAKTLGKICFGESTKIESTTQLYIISGLQILSALITLDSPHPLTLALICMLHLLFLLCWRGNFNGGSDYMSFQLYLNCALALLFKNNPPLAALFIAHLTFHLLLSYLKSGLCKIKNPHWRTGLALREFLSSAYFVQNSAVKYLCSAKRLLLITSWTVILFEVAFPLTLISLPLALTFMTLGIGFHLSVSYFFGLNRFIWTWIATYPALFYCTSIAKYLYFT